MGLLDVILLITIVGFGLFGLWFGLIHTLGSLLGTLIGAFVAGRFYEPGAEVFHNITGWSENVSRVIMFIVIFLIINRLVGFVFWIIERSVGIVTKFPFLKSINKMLGMLLGIFEGIITVGLIFYFIDIFPISDTVTGQIEASVIAPYTLSVALILLPLLPEGLKLLSENGTEIKSTVL